MEPIPSDDAISNRTQQSLAEGSIEDCLTKAVVELLNDGQDREQIVQMMGKTRV